jgi:hypothetical protein
MVKTFCIGIFIAAASGILPAPSSETARIQGVGPLPGQTPVMAPLESVHDPLQLALSKLQHSANQSCDIKKAIAGIKDALDQVAVSAAFLSAHADAASLSPLPPDVTPDFIPPPRPAPHRNEMVEGALTDLQSAFTRLARADGGGLDGHRDRLYHDLNDAAANLMAAIKTANASFIVGRREIPSCDPDRGSAPDR